MTEKDEFIKQIENSIIFDIEASENGSANLPRRMTVNKQDFQNAVNNISSLITSELLMNITLYQGYYF